MGERKNSRQINLFDTAYAQDMLIYYVARWNLDNLTEGDVALSLQNIRYNLKMFYLQYIDRKERKVLYEDDLTGKDRALETVIQNKFLHLFT